MPTTDALLAFLAAALVIIVIPGPTVLFVVGQSLSHGRRSGLTSVLGGSVGIIPIIVAVAFGVGTIVAQSVVIFTIVKILGAGYLVYLGVQGIRHRKVGNEAPEDPSLALETATDVDSFVPAGRELSYRSMFMQGFVIGISNPKTIIFFVAALPQFVSIEAGHVPLQMIILGLLFQALALFSDGSWAFIAGTARSWFARSPRRMSRIRGIGGGMLIGLGGTLAFASQ
ncbi:LysE family translocator [Brevibacterium antiquum]|uniref:Threonine/homoserine/homoserine lactone efflux protein n=1 Tax=Brevibacterium antiquum TaxID=234835 RepID=A0A2H1J0U6_9MICO|nr:LysE family translocator [Brevibacterium antiquum]SMX81033.1 Threonine/homoserine/homoserine lactone efflux protein [Brevibacterium antiquum]